VSITDLSTGHALGSMPKADVQPRAWLPRGSCDSHLHVFANALRYPVDPRRNYTPDGATLAPYCEVVAACGIERTALMQPSACGTDNRCLLDALRELGPEGGAAFGGIVVSDATTSDSDLEAMHALELRAMRLNLVKPQMLDVDAAREMVARMKHRGWHLQLHVSGQKAGEAQLAALAQRAERVGVAVVVVDPMGRPASGTLPRSLIELLAGGRTWAKLSAPYRTSHAAAPAHGDLLPLVRALVTANPDQMLCGSDWTHTEPNTAIPRIADLVGLLAAWVAEASLRHQVCVANPARLYDF
jgi:D-galactarolactone isomerase